MNFSVSLHEKFLINLYLDLMKKSLTRLISKDCYGKCMFIGDSLKHIDDFLKSQDAIAIKKIDRSMREQGIGYIPLEAETMTSLKRLYNLQSCIIDVIEKDIPGDLIETGVWRGGSVIFMRAVLKAYNVLDRTVWVADSFQGLPKPDGQYPEDKDSP